MPLSEFLRMARGKLEASQQKPSLTDLSSCPEDSFMELAWENGQVMMQGQSNRAKRIPSSNCNASQMPSIRDKYIGTGSSSKFGKFESVLEDAAPSVPTGEISLNQDDEIVPWLNYHMNDGFRQDFCSELLPEISGVTGNDPSTRNSLGSMDKSQMVRNSHNVPVHKGVNTDIRNASKVCSSNTGFLTPYLSHQGQIPVPSLGSGVSNAVMNSTSHNQNVSFGDAVQGHSSASGYVNMKTQKQNEGSSGSGSCLLNFSHFSRPAALFRTNLQPTDGLTASCSSGVEKIVNEKKVPAASSRIPIKPALVEPSSSPRKENASHNQPNFTCFKVESRPSTVKPQEKTCPAEQSNALCQVDSIKNDNYQNQEIGASTIKGLAHGEKSVEPLVAASSVCSGNSAERNSNDLTHNSKRKHRDNDESESRSEDIEEESVGIKKPTNGRGGSGSKRSRAAEVHNLSERRRRDRINEKMRALQELIPNCNKADKASMLDEAIEYLKTLQLQVQIMSMGAGLCMPPMMFPTGFQHMHAAHMPHFASMSAGMGFGMGMLDMNSRPQRYPIFPVPQMQGAHFPSPPIPGPSNTFQGLAGSNLQFFGHPGQGHPMSVLRAPSVPLTRQSPISSTLGSDPSRTETHAEALRTSPVFNHDVELQDKNSHLRQNAHASSSVNQTLPTTTDPVDQSSSLPKDVPVQDAPGNSTANLSSTDDVSRKEGSD